MALASIVIPADDEELRIKARGEVKDRVKDSRLWMLTKFLFNSDHSDKTDVISNFGWPFCVTMFRSKRPLCDYSSSSFEAQVGNITKTGYFFNKIAKLINMSLHHAEKPVYASVTFRLDVVIPSVQMFQ